MPMLLPIADYQDYLNYTTLKCWNCNQIIKKGEQTLDFLPPHAMPEVDEPVKVCQTCADKWIELGTPETLLDDDME